MAAASAASTFGAREEPATTSSSAPRTPQPEPDVSKLPLKSILVYFGAEKENEPPIDAHVMMEFAASLQAWMTRACLSKQSQGAERGLCEKGRAALQVAYLHDSQHP